MNRNGYSICQMGSDLLYDFVNSDTIITKKIFIVNNTTSISQCSWKKLFTFHFISLWFWKFALYLLPISCFAESGWNTCLSFKGGKFKVHFQKFRFFKTILLLIIFFVKSVRIRKKMQVVKCQRTLPLSSVSKVCYKMKVMFEMEKFKILGFITSKRFHWEKSENIKVGWK